MSWEVAGVHVERPPIVIDERPQVGPARASSPTLSGQRVVVEWPLTEERGELHILCPLVSDQAKRVIENQMKLTQPTYVFTGVRLFRVCWAERSRQKFTPLHAPFPDINQALGPVDPSLLWWTAELTFYPV